MTDSQEVLSVLRERHPLWKIWCEEEQWRSVFWASTTIPVYDGRQIGVYDYANVIRHRRKIQHNLAVSGEVMLRMSDEEVAQVLDGLFIAR